MSDRYSICPSLSEDFEKDFREFANQLEGWTIVGISPSDDRVPWFDMELERPWDPGETKTVSFIASDTGVTIEEKK